ncbi:MAG TPA: tail fiber domain-containing protein, partial [Candidatus Saccharimonadales bacterium]
NRMNLYQFRYLHGTQHYIGVMAQEVLPVRPDAVTKGSDGLYKVDYSALGLRMATLDEWKVEGVHAVLNKTAKQDNQLWLLTKSSKM